MWQDVFDVCSDVLRIVSYNEKYAKRKYVTKCHLELRSSGLFPASSGHFLPTFRDNLSVPS